MNKFDQKIHEAFEKALNIIQNHKTVLQDLSQSLVKNEAGLNVISSRNLPLGFEWQRLSPNVLDGEGNIILLEKSDARVLFYAEIRAGGVGHPSTSDTDVRISVIYGDLYESVSGQHIKKGESALFRKGQPRHFSTSVDTGYSWLAEFD